MRPGEDFLDLEIHKTISGNEVGRGYFKAITDDSIQQYICFTKFLFVIYRTRVGAVRSSVPLTIDCQQPGGGHKLYLPPRLPHTAWLFPGSFVYYYLHCLYSHRKLQWMS